MTKTEIDDVPLESLIPPDMTTVYMVFLKRGPTWTPEETEETEQLQKRHLAYLRQMRRAGKMIMSGPFTDGGQLRGVSVYRVETLEEARALAGADPAVLAGRLAVEVHPWFVSESDLPKKRSEEK
jgi:uncharacterized protein YciI